VPNIIQLLASLATSTNKLFLIEEPENDLHPTALKALLDLMIASSRSNQFVVSTHSNIVVRHLCGVADSRLLKVHSPPGVLPPNSVIEAVPATPEARISVLRELGYVFSDFDLWDGWIILEEASAERIIRDYLIPMFAPRLARVRTISAGGVDRVKPLLDDFLRLVIFTHLQPAYIGKTWVRVDGDDHGRSVVSTLRAKYPDWDADRFQTFASGQFERYYPKTFRSEVVRVLAIVDKSDQRKAKRELLLQVLAWLNSDLERARRALQVSASPVIEDLRSIEAQLDA
jgi:hypothetical protein